MNYKWRVVPLCEDQLLDIKLEDIIKGGVFRTCDVYKSGGGYDKFPQIFYNRTGRKTNPKQFVVQLYGCHLKCPYCYVTPEGVHGKYIEYTTDELVREFLKSGLEVFHLMGGSPALYINHWPDLIETLNEAGDFVFHSDLLLTEKRYSRETLMAISKENCLYAVNIKGITPRDYKKNTRKELDEKLFWYNFYDVVMFEVPMYVTFTNPSMEDYDLFCKHVEDTFGKAVLKDSFVIDIKRYDAVDAYNKRKRS